VGGNTAQITERRLPIHASIFDEWARFLNNVDVDPNHDDDQKIITYTVAVYQPTGYPQGRRHGGRHQGAWRGPSLVCDPVASNTDQQMINLMRSGATAGGGIYFDGSNLGSLRASFARILNEVQAKNSVFVSASLPVSVNYAGHVPEPGLHGDVPSGGHRQPALARQPQAVQDHPGPDDARAFARRCERQCCRQPGTGFVSRLRRASGRARNDFWKNDPSGTPKVASDLPDGEIVEKGARASRSASRTAPRRIRAGSSPARAAVAAPVPRWRTLFNNTDVSGAQAQTDFGVATPTELQLLVNWIRGQDNRTARRATRHRRMHVDVGREGSGLVADGASVGSR
jgi:type IV pilus assembly protein PilY1